jgi:uncharacterized membrane protein YwzB
MKKLKINEVIKKIGKPIGGVLEFTGELLGMNAMESIGSKIKGDPNLSDEEKAMLLNALELDVEDRANARDMQVQIATDENASWLSKNFVYLLAAFWSLSSVAYFFLVTFMNVVDKSVANTILGFLLGTAVGAIINFFFGSSEGSKQKDKMKFLSL